MFKLLYDNIFLTSFFGRHSDSSEIFEPTISAFERAKECHALDRASTVIGSIVCWLLKIRLSHNNSDVEAC
jgi:hypothetical protein